MAQLMALGLIPTQWRSRKLKSSSSWWMTRGQTWIVFWFECENGSHLLPFGLGHIARLAEVTPLGGNSSPAAAATIFVGGWLKRPGLQQQLPSWERLRPGFLGVFACEMEHNPWSTKPLLGWVRNESALLHCWQMPHGEARTCVSETSILGFEQIL